MTPPADTLLFEPRLTDTTVGEIADFIGVSFLRSRGRPVSDVPARRILRRIEFRYTPKHGSWLNMVEIEIGVLREQCLARRIDDRKRLRREITPWERQRNAARPSIKWMFTTEKARAKMGQAYPDASKES
jgi:hypothetical protein